MRRKRGYRSLHLITYLFRRTYTNGIRELSAINFSQTSWSGTHGKVAYGIGVITTTGSSDTKTAIRLFAKAGTHPGVIYASNRPKSSGYPRLFKFITVE